MRLLDALFGPLRRVKRNYALPSSLVPLLDLSYAALQRGDNNVARQLLLQVLEHRDDLQNPALMVLVLSRLAATWFRSEQYRECAEFFSQYIADHPQDALGYSFRAGSLWYAGSRKDAVEDYAKALEFDPKDSRALMGRGQIFVEQGEFQKAVQDLDAALENLEQLAVPDENWRTAVRAFTLNGRAAAYSGLGEFDRAISEFEKSILLRPHNAWVYYNRAEAYERRGKIPEALENYKLALTMKRPKLNATRRENAELKVKTLRA
ncbi:MAG TPA: tetratricopeptide repeat protein [Candidatus Acidoferrum sp.]|nr:tetratricopeptide repeat protein [Candidatus Acidoferrum sp.]